MRASQQAFLQNTSVELGFRYNLVLRGILALSAIYKAAIYPADSANLLLRSAVHISYSLGDFCPLLGKSDATTCAPVVALACVIGLHNFGIVQGQMPPDSTVPLLDYMRLVKGVKVVLGPHWLRIINTAVAPLIMNARREDVSGRIIEVLHLRKLVEKTTNNDNSIRRNACMQAADKLHNAYLAVQGCRKGQSALALIFIWPTILIDQFMNLLAEHDPLALVILTRFTVLFRLYGDC